MRKRNKEVCNSWIYGQVHLYRLYKTNSFFFFFHYIQQILSVETIKLHVILWLDSRHWITSWHRSADNQSESRIFSQVRIVSKILEGLTPIIKVATHTGELVPATSPCNYSPEEFTRRDWSQGLVPSSVYTKGPIAQESSKNWGQMVSFFHSTAFLRNQNS